MPEVAVETPCINVCIIDPGTGLCAGCYRSIDEISRWASMTPEQRRTIMAELPARERKQERR
ncbi:MAG: DUF1289 domain-containing protein [Pseudomonadota bacterium]|nr:DUF1289 domain-containing protein [Pseudomonadota bacterium]